MVLQDPGRIKDTKLQYYAFRWPNLFCALNVALCPFTCGCFWCWTRPMDQLSSDRRVVGPNVRKRMIDTHFARLGRKNLRRHSLSVDKPTGRLQQIIKRTKKSSTQNLSPLFAKLPYEIRMQIFKAALLDTGTVLIQTVALTDKPNSFHKLQALACEMDPETPPSLSVIRRDDAVHESGLATALLRTCRLVYIESLPLLYSQSQFAFHDPRHLVSFSHVTPRTHLQHIRSIRLTYSTITTQHVHGYPSQIFTFKIPLYWPMEEGFNVIRSLRQLRSIYVTFRTDADLQLPRFDAGSTLTAIQEYYERVRESTYESCKVHLHIVFGGDFIDECTEPGLLVNAEDETFKG